MRHFTITAAAVFLCLVMAGGATASGGLNCTAEGGPGSVEVDAGVTRGMGGPIFSLTATANIMDESVAEDLRKTEFERQHIAQYWLDADDLRLLLYRERDGNGPFGSVELTILAKPVGDDISYEGTYALRIFDMTGGGEGKITAYDGKIACSVE